jgi:hypothetical protein
MVGLDGMVSISCCAIRLSQDYEWNFGSVRTVGWLI